jgi:hypothetical protein
MINNSIAKKGFEMTHETAADMLSDIAQYLNEIIRTTGKQIDINNHALWDRYFHTWTNQDWDIMLTALEDLMATAPDLFKPWHRRNIQEARSAWHAQKNSNDRILDSKKHKRKAWACVMTIREIVNAVNGIELENVDSKVTVYTEPQPTVFGRLFTY